MTLLAVKQLSKSFGGVHAIADLDLQIHEGAVHSIIGPNGAGKTSLINLLSGVYAPGTGSIKLNGQELAGRATYQFAQAGIGRTFQNLQVFFNMTALENVMTGRHLRQPCSLWASLLHTPKLRRAEAQCRASARQLLQRVGLEAYEDDAADSMPYGAQAGTTVILVEHNMRLVMEVSDHVFVLDHGRKLAEGTPEQVSGNPQVIEAYLGAPDAATSAAQEVAHA